MGCLATVAAPDLIVLDYEEDEVVGDLTKEYNEFCIRSKRILREVIMQSKKVGPPLLKFIEDAKRNGSIASKMLESIMNLIIYILHYQRSKGSETFSVMFSNYLPGILVDPRDLSEKLRLKYENITKLAAQLPEVFSHFDNYSKNLVQCISLSRDYYPKEFYKLVTGPSKLSLSKFVVIERDLLENFDMIAETGKLLDTMFKNCKDCLRVVLQVIEQCDSNTEEVYAIFDELDEWNYDTIPDSIQNKIQEFIVKTGIKVPE